MLNRKLSRSLVVAITQNLQTDCLEIDGLDPEEQDLPVLSQLFSTALQQPTSLLNVLELTGLNREAAGVVATALKAPGCQLKGLVLKRMAKAAVAEIVAALREQPLRHIGVTDVGLIGTTSHAVYLSLSAATAQYQFQCTDLSGEWLRRYDAISLAPLAYKRPSYFSLLPASERLFWPDLAPTPSQNGSPWVDNGDVVPNRASVLVSLARLENEALSSLPVSQRLRHYSPISPSSARLMNSPMPSSSRASNSPSSPGAGPLHALRAWLHPSGVLADDKSPVRRHTSFDSPIATRVSSSSLTPRALNCPPSSPNVGLFTAATDHLPAMSLITTDLSPRVYRMRDASLSRVNIFTEGHYASPNERPTVAMDSPQRTLLAFKPPVSPTTSSNVVPHHLSPARRALPSYGSPFIEGMPRPQKSGLGVKLAAVNELNLVPRC